MFGETDLPPKKKCDKSPGSPPPSPPLPSEACFSADFPTINRPTTHWEAGDHPVLPSPSASASDPSYPPPATPHLRAHPLLFISTTATSPPCLTKERFSKNEDKIATLSCLNLQRLLPSTGLRAIPIPLPSPARPA